MDAPNRRHTGDGRIIDYSKSPADLSISSVLKIEKTCQVYEESYQRKRAFRETYNRHLDYLRSGGKLSFTLEQMTTAFRAKDFWHDLFDCGSFLTFRYYQKADETKLFNANFCKRDKLCVSCSVRRAYKQHGKFLSIIESEPELLNNDWYYIVVPIKHTAKDDFIDVFLRIESLKKRMTQQMRDGRKGKSTGFFSKFLGGMYSIETTKTKNGWNVHINLLVNAPKGTKIGLNRILNRRKQESFQNEELREFLLRNYDSQMHNIAPLDFKDIDLVKAALVEVLKYSLKFSSLSSSDLLEIFIKTRKKRLFGTFGNLWGKGLEDVELEGDEEPDDDYIELIFRRVVEGGLPDYMYHNLTKSPKNVK